MTRLSFKQCLAVLVALAGALGVPAGLAAQAKRMNIIVIVTDDQSRWSVGAYGNREAITPNMDRLAREGALFTNAFVATPVCSPSRATFLTGLYPTRMGITDYIGLEARARLGLPPERTTWPEVLQQNGYVTALEGKWHLGMQPQFHPTRNGYDHFYGFVSGASTPMDPVLEVDGKEQKLTGSMPDLLVDDAIRFLDANRSRPFALSLHFRAPHLPYGPVPEEDSALFKDLDPTIPDFPGLDKAQVKQWYREYYASVHSVDRNLGRLLARLEELGLSEDTIVVFTSDHGYMIGQHGMHSKGNGWWVVGGLRGPRRPNMWDDSLMVPLIIRWPGVVKPGTVIDECVSNIDTFASVLGMLGIPIPKGVEQDGLDFSPFLRGEKVAVWRDAVFGQYDLHNSNLAFMRSIRTDKWKLVRFHLTNLMNELYNLEDDPGELHNLYYDPAYSYYAPNEAYKEIRDQLEKRLAEWEKSIDDPILSPNFTQFEPINHRPGVVLEPLPPPN